MSNYGKRNVLSVEFENIEIDRENRTGKKTENSPRTIILKLNNYEDKSMILKRRKMLKGPGIFVNENFRRETIEHRKQLWNEVKRHK